MRGRLVCVAFVAGATVLHQVARLPEPWTMVLLALACAMLCGVYGCMGRRTGWVIGLLVMASAIAGFTYAGWRAQWRLDDVLACVHRDQVTRLTVRVNGLPTGTEQARTFDVQVLDNGAYCTDPLPGDCAPATPSLPGIPGGVRVSWRVPIGSSTTLPEVWPGQVWRMALRLRAPHASQNPYAPDIEARLFAQGVRALGSVRGTPLLLADDPWASPMSAVARIRHELRTALYRALGDKPYAPILVALALGDQSALPRSDWTMLSRAGISHLVAISGLHVGLVAGLAAGCCGFFYRRWRIRQRLAAQVVPAQIMMAMAAWVAAALYCTLAGWGIPARRVFFMLSTVAVAVMCRVPVSASRTLALAAGWVVLVDPWAPLAIGFWLSFAAVAALMMMAASATRQTQAGAAPVQVHDDMRARRPVAEPAGVHVRALWRQRRMFRLKPQPAEGQAVSSSDDLLHVEEVPPTQAESWHALARALRTQIARGCRSAGRMQGLLTLALTPLLAVTVGQVSLVSPLVNAFAIPIVGAIVTPLALGCAALAGAGRLGVPGAGRVAGWIGAGAHAILAPTLDAARFLSAPDWAIWSVAKAPWPYAALALGCAAWGLMPRGAPGRRLAWGGLLPLLLWRPAPLPLGAWDLVALDVGQAGAAVITTRHHVVVFDTGLRYEGGDDAGARILVPFLQAIGRTQVDRLIVSHAHLDHMGGVRGLMSGMPIVRSHSPFDLNAHLQREAAMLHDSVPARGWPLDAATCEAGQAWTFDGVTFSFHHPQAGQRYSQAQANASSCVLVVRGTHHSAVLPGDIGASEELSMVNGSGASLESSAGRGLQDSVDPVPAGHGGRRRIGRIDVALAAHHGSLTSSSPAWIAALEARHVIAQAAYGSPFGHPAPRVQQRWIESGAAFWRNDLDGAVWVASRAEGLDVRAWRDQGMHYWHEPLTDGAHDRCAVTLATGGDGLR